MDDADDQAPSHDPSGERPLGAPTGPLRSTGRVQGLSPFSPLSLPRADPKPPKDGSVGLGVALAFGLVVVSWITIEIASAIPYASAYATSVGWLVFIPLAYVVGIHVYAIKTNQTRILAGFWIAFAVLFLVLVISCFAFVFAAFG